MTLDSIDRRLFRAARERDRQLWLVDALKKWRKALEEGRDGEDEAREYMRRGAVIWATPDPFLEF